MRRSCHSAAAEARDQTGSQSLFPCGSSRPAGAVDPVGARAATRSSTYRRRSASRTRTSRPSTTTVSAPSRTRRFTVRTEQRSSAATSFNVSSRSLTRRAVLSSTSRPRREGGCPRCGAGGCTRACPCRGLHASPDGPRQSLAPSRRGDTLASGDTLLGVALFLPQTVYFGPIRPSRAHPRELGTTGVRRGL
jgi:hypothetical protein